MTKPAPKTMDDVARKVRVEQIKRHRETLHRYIADRLEDADYRAISYAANDLREMVVELRCLEDAT